MAPGSSIYERITNIYPNFKKRLLSLWILDFDACKPILMDENGVRLAVKAFLETDPYCPRPSTECHFAKELWKLFCTRYMHTAARLVRGTNYHHLPVKFIQGISNEYRLREENRRETQVAPPTVVRGRGTAAVSYTHLTLPTNREV